MPRGSASYLADDSGAYSSSGYERGASSGPRYGRSSGLNAGASGHGDADSSVNEGGAVPYGSGANRRARPGLSSASASLGLAGAGTGPAVAAAAASEAHELAKTSSVASRELVAGADRHAEKSANLAQSFAEFERAHGPELRSEGQASLARLARLFENLGASARRHVDKADEAADHAEATHQAAGVAHSLAKSSSSRTLAASRGGLSSSFGGGGLDSAAGYSSSSRAAGVAASRARSAYGGY